MSGPIGITDNSGFNDTTMTVVFAMTHLFNDELSEHQSTSELITQSLMTVNCLEQDYCIEEMTLDNLHYIIDGTEVKFLNGKWVNVNRFYLDRKTMVVFEVAEHPSYSDVKRVVNMYLQYGSNPSKIIKSFLSKNAIQVRK